jgi:hypothetical protein
VVHFENRVSIIGQSVRVLFSEKRAAGFRKPGIKGATNERRDMETRTGFLQLISAVVGLSVGVGVMTATVLLGVAALLQ